MTTVTLSPKYQIVIPKALRESAGLKAGQALGMVYYNGHIHLVPVKSAKELQGSMKGIGSDPEREKEDRI